MIDNPAEDNEIAVAQLYDMIQKQKQSIEEERSVYCSLLSEHEACLELLARKEVVCSSLNAALNKLCGKDAVDEAMEEAERALAQQASAE
jgi:hypothetical protein